MTVNKGFKQRVRARASKTGESYTAALQHIRNASASAPNSGPGDDQLGRIDPNFLDALAAEQIPTPQPIKIAVAQANPPSDPGDRAALREAGRVIRALMNQAHEQGAALVHFGEGALCAPGKRIMSSDPDRLADADWSRFDWVAQRRELKLIADHAADLELWTIVGAVHQLSAPRRPHNSLYVIDRYGQIVTRYDERMLSFTKSSYMYTPGAGPVTFDLDGVRFGCALGMESVYPEVFMAYENSDVDCVLFSSHGPSASFAMQVQGHASTNSFWVSYATTCSTDAGNAAGVAGRDGYWVGRCTGEQPAVALAEINGDEQNFARPWRRKARGELILAGTNFVEDPRAARGAF